RRRHATLSGMRHRPHPYPLPKGGGGDAMPLPPLDMGCIARFEPDACGEARSKNPSHPPRPPRLRVDLLCALCVLCGENSTMLPLGMGCIARFRRSAGRNPRCLRRSDTAVEPAEVPVALGVKGSVA